MDAPGRVISAGRQFSGADFVNGVVRVGQWRMAVGVGDVARHGCRQRRLSPLALLSGARTLRRSIPVGSRLVDNVRGLQEGNT